MRICLATSGTRGDVFPFLALGRELASRGHEVFVVTHPYFARDIAEAGLEIEPIGERFDLASMHRHPDLFHHRRADRLVFGWVRDSIVPVVEGVRAVIGRRRPDVAVCHHFLLGAAQACRGAGVRCVNVCLAPVAWLALDDPVPALQKRPGPLASMGARALMPLTRPIVGAIGDRLFSEELRRADVEPGRGVLVSAWREGDLNLGMWSHHFRGPCADDPARGIITGFAWHDGHPGAALSPALERFLDAGEPPVVFAMGSAAHHTAGNFFEMGAAACAELGVRGVLVTGDEDRSPRGLPEGVIAVAHAPFGLVFPRAAVTVQHGGIGSVARALRAGRPTLVVPRAHDQFNNGVRVQRLGVGLTRPFQRLDRRGMVRAVRRLMEDRAIERRAEEMGERLAEEDGARVAADHIEAFCGVRTGRGVGIASDGGMHEA